MPSGNLNVLPIPDEVITNVNNLLQQIEAALQPYIVTLTDEERKTIAKVSDKTVAFVTKVNDYSTTNPQFVPAFMNAGDLAIDVENYQKLNPVLRMVQQIADQVSDTAMVAGSEAYIASLMYYGSVKSADKNKVADARAIYEDLSKRFPGRPKKEKPLTV
jgi:hypothetical protein